MSEINRPTQGALPSSSTSGQTGHIDPVLMNEQEAPCFLRKTQRCKLGNQIWPNNDHGKSPDQWPAGFPGSSSFSILLSLAGACGVSHWRSQLWYCLIFALNTATAFHEIRFQVRRGVAMMAENGPFLEVCIQTQFFGLLILLIWLTLVTTFSVGRRRSNPVMQELLQHLKQMKESGWERNSQESLVALFPPVSADLRESEDVVLAQKLHSGMQTLRPQEDLERIDLAEPRMTQEVHPGRKTIGFLRGRQELDPSGRESKSPSSPAGVMMWALIIFTAVATLAGEITNQGALINCRKEVNRFCVLTVLGNILFTLTLCCFQLIPGKFMFSGGLIISGVREINTKLKLLTSSSSSDDLRQLRCAGAHHQRLITCFRRLTDSMTPELTGSLLFGVAVEIAFLLTLSDIVAGGGGVTSVLPLLLHLTVAAVPLVGPCEISERVRRRVSESRDILLQLQRGRPELRDEVSLLLAEVQRDLETLGELGLFHLRRSTLTDVTSAVITYVVVMVQFHAAEEDAGHGEPPSAKSEVVLTPWM